MAVAMNRARSDVVGWESPRATTLPPRRLRAALHPLRHPLETRCARLEPRPALINMRLAAALRPRPAGGLPTHSFAQRA